MLAPKARQNDQASRYLELGPERLEDRRLLAGNVTVLQTPAGDIRITGDNSSNRIAVKSDVNGDLLVQGVGSTTVNGNNSETIQLATHSTIERNLIVNMRQGGDTVQIVNVDVTGRTSVNLGSGYISSLTIAAGTFGDRVDLRSSSDFNNIFFQSATVHANVNIRTGSGRDDFMVTGTSVDGDLRFALGSNADTLLLQNASITGRMVAAGGSGHDLMKIRNVTVQGDAVLQPGSDGDAIGIFNASANRWDANMAGGDDLFVFFHAGGDMDVKMGGGSDIVWGACSAIGKSEWNLGSGELDFAMFENEFLGEMSLVGGGGSDQVLLHGATFGGPMSISLGASNDGLGISNSTTFAAGGNISGSGGDDLFFVPAGFVLPGDIELVSYEQEFIFSNSFFDDAANNLAMRAADRWSEYGGNPLDLVC